MTRRSPWWPPGAGWAAFPRQHARTQRFTLGEPRSFRVAPDGSRVAFLRSAAGDDASTRLMVVDLPSGEERCVVDPAVLGTSDGDLPEEERARRERVRESAGGVVAYRTDAQVRRATFALGGQVFVSELDGGQDALALAAPAGAVDPALDPTGERVAFVGAGALYVAEVAGGPPRRLSPAEAAGDAGEAGAGDVTWGLAEFVAAEEMGRTRGHWWSPDGRRLVAARVDVSGVARWWITDPSDPGKPPRAVRYPAAGTANADVRLAILDLDGGRVDLNWDRDAYPYVAAVRWDTSGDPLVVVQSRDQRTLLVLEADSARGSLREVAAERDPHWVELLPGVPRRLPDGRVLHAAAAEDTRRIAVDGVPLTPAGLHVRSVAGIADGAVLVTASTSDPTAVGAWAVPLDGTKPEPLDGPGGVHTVTGAGAVTVVTARGLDRHGARTEVHHPGGTLEIASLAETPAITASPRLERVGERSLATALLLPEGYDPSDGPLPVLLDPYGGPHAQRVLQASAAFGVSQWFADAGFAVVVADGRGSPGRGLAWEREVAADLASAPLADQVDALHALAERHPGVCDLERVAIRGWSFGGFLAALAVLRRPDVFHAAVAGAPVVDWALYDTYYTERYLGLPEDGADAYTRSSLLPDAPRLERPLLVIHGLADDNVVAAHTLRLSRALLEAGRPHRVLPLVGVTHMTPQEVVAENLLRLQLEFLCEALDVPAP